MTGIAISLKVSASRKRREITAVDTAQNSNNTTVGMQARGLDEVSLDASLQIPCASLLH